MFAAKRALYAFLAIAFIATSAFAVATPQFVASKESDAFHLSTCKMAQKIKPSNAVYFNTRDEAIKAGHRPCKICKP